MRRGGGRRATIRVLLINPPIAPEAVYGRFAAAAPRLPALGLGYLSSYLRRAGREARVLDMPDLDGLGRLLERERPRVVGVTATSISFPSAARVLARVKTHTPDCLTVLGGAHVSALPERSLEQCPQVDIGVIGEGEQTLLELCERLGNGAPLDDVAGTVVRAGSELRTNAPRAAERNLDRLPPPDREHAPGQGGYEHTPFRGAGETVSLITSRGCPFNCAYCDQSVFGRSWRAHSAERVLEEVEQAAAGGAQFISFEDDNFLLDRARVQAICRGLQRRRPVVEWGCSGRVGSLDRELLELMRAAGCRVVYVGIEAASPRVLELLERRLDPDQARAGVQLIRQAGLRVYGSFVLGVPTETHREILETIDFAAKLPLDGASFFLFVPYPGTRLRRLAQETGTVSDDWSDYSGHPRRPAYIPHGVSAKRMLGYQSRAYLRFFLGWRYLRTHLPQMLSPAFVRRAAPVALRASLDLVRGRGR